MSKSIAKRATGLKNAKLRVEAAMVYVGHAEGISIEQLHKDPRFSHLSLSTLERWCRRDHWVEQRQSFIDSWREKAREQLAGKLAEERLAELDLIDEIRDAGLTHIRANIVAPKSYEGVMKATLEALKYKDELRSKIGEDVIDRTVEGAQGLPTEDAVDLPSDVARSAAMAAIAARRDAMRARAQKMLPATTPASGVVQQEHAEIQSAIETTPADLRSASSAGAERGDQDSRLLGPVRVSGAGGSGRGRQDGGVEDAVAEEQAQLLPVEGG